MNKSLTGRWNAISVASVALLVLSFAFGGASRSHALRLAVVELAALPLMVLAANHLVQTGLWRAHRFALGILAALFAVPLVQLIPLPPGIWTQLPGRDQMVLALELSGLRAGWSPLSLAPELTWRSALALTPPAAFFLATLSLSVPERDWMIRICIAAATAGLFLAAGQLISGGDHFYLWDWTNRDTVTGFFANRNHFASALLVTLPFVIMVGAATLRRQGQQHTSLWLGALFAGVVVVALAVIRSRAAIALFAPVMMITLLAAWIAAGRGRPSAKLLALVGSTAAALTAVAVLALPPILERFDTRGLPEARFERWPLIAETAGTYLPLGSGIGSFDILYRSVEPLNDLDATYFNQAHNEYLETWLESGWLGAALILAFCLWYVRRCWSAWKAPSSRQGDFARAASISIGAVLLHSVVDYPLRTTALAVVFALCCGLLEYAGRPNQRSRA